MSLLLRDQQANKHSYIRESRVQKKLEDTVICTYVSNVCVLCIYFLACVSLFVFSVVFLCVSLCVCVCVCVSLSVMFCLILCLCVSMEN